MILKLHQFLLKQKILWSKKVVLAGLCLFYPLTYAFWCYKMNELWFKNNLRFLHPEVIHPAFGRYDDFLSNGLKSPVLVAQEIQEVNAFESNNKVDNVLQNLKKYGLPLEI